MSAEHVIFFPAPDGSPAFRRLPSLDEVVAFVEHLRNERDVREVSVHSLTEVPLAFKTVYRVEVAAAAADAEPVAEATVFEPAPEAPAEPVAVDAPAVDAAAEPVADAADAVAEVPAQPESPESEPVTAGDAHSLGFFAS